MKISRWGKYIYIYIYINPVRGYETYVWNMNTAGAFNAEINSSNQIVSIENVKIILFDRIIARNVDLSSMRIIRKTLFKLFTWERWILLDKRNNVFYHVFSKVWYFSRERERRKDFLILRKNRNSCWKIASGIFRSSDRTVCSSLTQISMSRHAVRTCHRQRRED